jgi:hypothetical protein
MERPEQVGGAPGKHPGAQHQPRHALLPEGGAPGEAEQSAAQDQRVVEPDVEETAGLASSHVVEGEGAERHAQEGAGGEKGAGYAERVHGKAAALIRIGLRGRFR